MRTPKITLQESLFDGDLVKKNIIDSLWNSKISKDDLFYCLETYLQCANIDDLPKYLTDIYYNNEEAFKLVMHELYEAFTKQKYYSWIVVTEDDFEKVGNEMTEEEIDKANKELDNFFKNAKVTDRDGRFIVGNGKIPFFILNILKSSDHWKPQMANIKNWAIEYYFDYCQTLVFYGCPNYLNPIIKKFLYEK